MGKRLAIVLAVLALAVFVAGFLAAWPRIREEWYIRRLGSEDEAVRKTAAERLGEMRSVRALPKLISRLRRNLDGEGEKAGGRSFPIIEHEGLALCNALGRVGTPAVPALLELFGEGEFMRQFAATLALRFMGPAARPAVQALLGDPKLGAAAAQALAVVDAYLGVWSWKEGS